jgi:FkbM family methyltransferase
MVRIGSDYGGWTLPEDLIEESWICYCGGVGTDVTFDLGLIERYGCTIHAFDPTPSSVRYVRETVSDEHRFRFYPWGLWSADCEMRFYAPSFGESNFSVSNLQHTKGYFEAHCRSLQSIMRELGHDHVDLLKLDIEGAEYEVLRSVLDGNPAPVVICVEFHKTRGFRIGRMAGAVRALRSRGYVPVHVSGYDVTFASAKAAGA